MKLDTHLVFPVNLENLFLRFLSVSAFDVDVNGGLEREGLHKLCVRDVLKKYKQNFIMLFFNDSILVQVKD